MMFATSKLVAIAATLFSSGSLATAIPASSQNIVARGGGYPASNPPNVTCFNTWETVTNDPVVQYWYVVVANAGNSIKADRVWNHLNLNDCAPTENKYYVKSSINGSALTFHASEACTATAVSNAIRSGSEPGINVACQFTGKDGPDPGESAATGIDGAFNAILESIGALGD